MDVVKLISHRPNKNLFLSSILVGAAAVARAIARSGSANLSSESVPRFHPMFNGFQPNYCSGPATMAMRIEKVCVRLF